MEIKTNEYNVWLDAGTNTVHMEGAFRLAGPASYSEIEKALEAWTNTNQQTMNLDLRCLEYLNSSGINMLAKFTIGVRNTGGISLTVKGNKDIAWQNKSLSNLKKLYTSLELVIE